MGNAIQQQLLKCGLVPIVRGSFSIDQLKQVAETLLEAEINVVEVTLNSQNALEGIAALRKQFGDTMLIGAGTVRTLDGFHSAIGAGAQFTIAPNLDNEVMRAAVSGGIVHLPGVFTPTEIQNAVNLGATVVKLFPIDTMGPKYLKAIRAPLNDVLIVPTGGGAGENNAAYRGAGACAVGLGSALVTGPSQSLDDLRARAVAFRKAWDQAATC